MRVAIQRRRRVVIRLLRRRKSGSGSLDLAVKFDFFFKIGNLVFLAPKLLCVPFHD
jgi:hypothetical protein